MPELPDLEVFKKNVYDQLSSKKLAGVEIFNINKVMVATKTLADALSGKELLRIDRLGKELIFDFGDQIYLTAHLMLSGRMSIVPETEIDTINKMKHKIFALSFARETLVFSDVGALCTIKYKPPLTKTPDAFADTFTWEYFLKTAKKKAMTNVKAFLIDQKIVKGIGNAYADEILWDARISPRTLVGKIPEENLKTLYHSIGSVLRDAVIQIKRISPDIIAGEERSFLKVHNKKLKETITGYPILVERIASKTTYYTKEQTVFY